MQITHLPKNVYRLADYAYLQASLEVRRAEIEPSIRKWEQLRANGLNEATCAEIVEISRATFYRRKRELAAINRGEPPPPRGPKIHNKPQWGKAEAQLVLRIRRENPTWGKIKIGTVLRRDYGFRFSEGTVGRILTHLKEKGLITRSRACTPPRRKRNFNKGHAKPWFYKDYDKMEIGERVQIDHMSITKNNNSVKHFQAWDRVSKHISAQIYSNAKASSAKKFLQELVENAPYRILSIQVDGGSEFMAEFDQSKYFRAEVEQMLRGSDKT